VDAVQIPSTSTIWMYIPIDPPDTVPDVTIYPGEAALIPDDGTEPADGDYHDAEWINGELALLVGPGPAGAVYPTGDYMAFARITAGAEIPVLKSGRVRIGVAGN
jgi:hypothetical protein